MTRRVPGGWWPDALVAAGFVALTAALAVGWFLDLDLAVRAWSEGHQATVPYWTARALNYLGNSGPLAVLALVIAALVAWRRGSLRPLLVPVVAFAVTIGVVLPVKLLTDRAAPRSPLPDAVELFNDLPPGEYGESYPAGHMVVAIIWFRVLLTLVAALMPVPARLGVAIRVAPPLIVAFTTTYLNFHWLTDVAAGLLLGVLLDRLLARMPWMHLPAVTPTRVFDRSG